MNQNHLIALCKIFKLGTPIDEPQRVYGGLLHTMWRVNADSASYAVKQLSPHIDLTKEDIVHNYDLTEDIACRFSEKGIPAIFALKQAGNYLTLLDGTGFLIYPWVEAKSIHQDTVSEYHALMIANMLAKMHQINLDVPDMATPKIIDNHSNEYLIKMFGKAQSHHCPFAAKLIENQQAIIAINSDYQNTISLLNQQLIVSHGDLDPKNVLWDQYNKPLLIDWECARKLNPTLVIVHASLDWSGITANFNKDTFIKMMEVYIDSGGPINKSNLQAAFDSVLGNWINWMVYNIERACLIDDPEQKALGIEQVDHVLRTIINIKSITPDLMNSLA